MHCPLSWLPCFSVSSSPIGLSVRLVSSTANPGSGLPWVCPPAWDESVLPSHIGWLSWHANLLWTFGNIGLKFIGKNTRPCSSPCGWISSKYFRSLMPSFNHLYCRFLHCFLFVAAIPNSRVFTNYIFLLRITKHRSVALINVILLSNCQVIT